MAANLWFNRARRLVGLRYWSLSAFAKAKVKNAVNIVSSFEEAVARECKRRGLDGVVCDEPTGDLDRKTADEILGLLQTLNRDHGKTIVMVTHDAKAAEYATHQLHMDKGQLVEQASA